MWRDIYYVADSWERARMNDVVTDFDHPFDRELENLPTDPSLWPRFRERHHVEFPLSEDQFFVMGDNSPESSDARLWLSGDPADRRPSRRRVPRTTTADRQGALRLLAPFLEPHPRHPDPVSAVSKC